MIGAVALLLTLPTETILVKALTTPTQKQAAQQYAAALTPDQLTTAGSAIATYPVAYRRAIMTALPAAARAAVWQNHIAAYLASNPGLDSATQNALQSAIVLLTPDLLSRAATDAERAEIHAIAGEVTASLGKDTALNLLYNLGPADGTFASAEPISDKLANLLRRTFVVHADGGGDCDCNTGWGCDSGTSCYGSTGCSGSTGWPACGWLWEDPCNGSCGTGIGA
jgi:hypothetical protein